MSRWVGAMRLIGVGFFISTSIIGGVVVGLWLDSKFNTEPLLVIIGLLLGIAVAVYGVYEMLLPLLQRKRDNGDG
ncbi:MAG: AtpZ/AtpI family protein [Chloroflexi bacterium]|nr:AtpZ/AtpI family protein [Chloroflexota bacterium]